MGTYYRIVLVSEKAIQDTKIGSLEQQISHRLDQINQAMSTYITGSEISEFNQLYADKRYKLSADFKNVVEASLALSKRSGGAFDITAQPLIEAWGFDSASSNIKSLSHDELTQVQSKIGYQKLILDQAYLSKTHSGVKINLSAVAKGYAVDQISKLISDAGVSNHLVDIGGELKAVGHNKRSNNWQLGIETPVLAALGGVEARIQVSDLAVATSGDYRNYIEIFGQRFSHVIDPIQGAPIRHRLASVTVLHESAMYADGWATALMVLGDEKGFELAQKAGLKALFLNRKAVNSDRNSVKSKPDGYQIRSTSSFEPYLVND